MLSGKYLDGARPKGSRWTLVQRNGLFRGNPQRQKATKAYCDIAAKYNMTPSQLALAWVDQVDLDDYWCYHNGAVARKYCSI
jgi:aryl-alcohol dehydrogenase-like predicted oxidoreductase